jgi:hypothetical protein
MLSGSCNFKNKFKNELFQEYLLRRYKDLDKYKFKMSFLLHNKLVKEININMIVFNATH